MSNVKEDNSADRAFGILDYETRVVTTLTIKNKTATKQNFIPASQLYVRSADGAIYRMHPFSVLTNQIGFQEVASGATITGDAAFVIPKVLTNPLLYVDLGWDNYIPIVYDVLK